MCFLLNLIFCISIPPDFKYILEISQPTALNTVVSDTVYLPSLHITQDGELITLWPCSNYLHGIILCTICFFSGTKITLFENIWPILILNIITSSPFIKVLRTYSELKCPKYVSLLLLKPQSHSANFWSQVSTAKQIGKIPAEICEGRICFLHSLARFCMYLHVPWKVPTVLKYSKHSACAVIWEKMLHFPCSICKVNRDGHSTFY